MGKLLCHWRNLLVGLTLVLITAAVLCGQTAIYDTGGPLLPEQAAYDVTFYDLQVRVFPDREALEGVVEVRVRVVQPLLYLVLDLDTLLQVGEVMELAPQPQKRQYQRRLGKIWIPLGTTRQPGETLRLKVAYGGRPRKAPRPPWEGGITWAETPSDAPWIASSCQSNGADVWWPVKDHVSDKPDSMAIHLRVPDPLVAASNGRLRGVEQHGDGTTSYHWYVSNPISAYNVALNVAPYRSITAEHTSVAGDKFPVTLYVLPENYSQGQKLFAEILTHIQFYEKLLGPYPFRADKYAAVQTPHLGMEHQTITAYGANFDNGAMTRGRDWGFDALHHHEFGHEWWGNLITNADWQDMWIHEGFCSYMQALYLEELKGPDAYRAFLQQSRNFSTALPIAPRSSRTGKAIYQAPIYNKGAWTLHTLRYVLGDSLFFRSLRQFCYPTPAQERLTNGRQVRFVHTDDYQTLCEQLSGTSLAWFFEVYLRQAELPRLLVQQRNQELVLRWELAAGQGPFPLPVEVKLGNEIKRLAMPPGGATLRLKPGDQPEIDPQGWLLCTIVRQP